MIPRIISNTFAAIFSHKWKILLAVVVLIGLRCAWLWQPERQVRLHQEHFLEAAQDGNWQKFYGAFDEGFRLPNGQDKTWALQMARQVFKQFITLQIRASDTTLTMQGETGTVRTMIRIAGTGTEIAEMAKSEVNESKEPFEFTWKHASWKPWDWKLTGVEHPLLHRNVDME